MLASIASLVQTYGGAPGDHCNALARAALSGDELMAGGQRPADDLVQQRADDHRGPGASASRGRARSRTASGAGRCSSISGNRMWGGYVAMLRGDLVEAEDLLDPRARGVHRVPVRRAGGDVLRGVPVRRAARARQPRRGGAGAHVRGDIQRRVGRRALLARARLALLVAQGRYEEALVAADDLVARYPVRGQPGGRAVAVAARTRALLRRARPTRRSLLVDEELALARAFGAPPADRPRAARPRRADRRRRHAARGGRGAGRLAGPARARVGARLLRCGRDATPPRCAGRTSSRRPCGADGLVDRSHARRSGPRGDRRPTSHAERRRPDRRRAPRRHARGRGPHPRDIAQALFLTPRTVEIELASATRKLGVETPDGPLAAALRAA